MAVIRSPSIVAVVLSGGLRMVMLRRRGMGRDKVGFTEVVVLVAAVQGHCVAQILAVLHRLRTRILQALWRLLLGAPWRLLGRKLIRHVVLIWVIWLLWRFVRR